MHIRLIKGATMVQSTHDVPSTVDPTSLMDLVDDCRCLEGECAGHGVDLHPAAHPDDRAHVEVVITEQTQHAVDDVPDFV